MKLEDAIQLAEDTLPRGWEIHVRMTCSGAQVVAVRPDMSEVDMDDYYLDYEEQFATALKLAGDEVAADLLYSSHQAGSRTWESPNNTND